MLGSAVARGSGGAVGTEARCGLWEVGGGTLASWVSLGLLGLLSLVLLAPPARSRGATSQSL